MTFNDFTVALEKLNFVGVPQKLELLFSLYAEENGMLNIPEFVSRIIDMNARQKRDAIRRENDKFFQDYA